MLPADKNAVAADCRRYRAFRDSILHFRRGNVPCVLAATFRARLFLFPVDCSLFPLYYPLLFHQQLDKSEYGELNTSEVIITDERVQHIQEHHPADYGLYG